MINKFQQGGKQDAVMQFVQGIAEALQVQPDQIIQAAQQNPQALEAAVQTYQQTQDIQQAAQTFAQTLQKNTQVARHGAKLQYIKSLKHQCAEDEELYYYKKGGSLGCGCVKKQSEGGKTPPKKSPVDKFKNRKQDQATKDSIAINRYGAEDLEATRPGSYKKNKEGKIQWTPDRTQPPYNKIKKNCGGSKVVANFKARKKS